MLHYSEKKKKMETACNKHDTENQVAFIRHVGSLSFVIGEETTQGKKNGRKKCT
jgi:hypothetical protein